MSGTPTKLLIALGLMLGSLAVALPGCRNQSASYNQEVAQPTDPSAGQASAEQQLANALELLLPVKMQPQVPLASPPYGVEIQPPSYYSAKFVGDFPAATSFVQSSAGADYFAGLPHRGVAQQDQNAVFDQASNGTGWNYCTYALDASEGIERATLCFSWQIAEENCPLCQASRPDFQVGLADSDSIAWTWYAGPRDDVLTLASLKFVADDDVLFITVAVNPQTSAELRQISVGQPERRAAGMISFSEDEPGMRRDNLTAEPPRRTMSLPAAIDLSDECSYVRDQGSIQSCGAFTVGDGAYNFELQQIYGQYGWDFNSTIFSISPKYLYRNTPGACPDGYRGFSDVLNWVLLHGAATEFNCPYINVCDDDWGQPAIDDAAVLRVDDWDWVYWNPNQGLDGIKAVLVDEHRPVMMRTELDAAFENYQPGQIWDYAGPSVAGHGMLIVGYDDAQSAFWVRNSWGSDWGDAGYLWIAYSTFLNEAANVACCKLIDSYSPAVLQRFLVYISNITPTRCTSGTPVTITGVNFGAVQGYSYVEFGGGIQPAVGDYLSWSDSQIQVKVPPDAISGAVTVTVSTESSNGIACTIVLRPPIIGNLDQL